MKKILQLLTSIFILGGHANGQNVNLIIQVNDKLVIGGISQIECVIVSDKPAKKTSVNYIPGNLTLTKEVWNDITSDTSKKLLLYFDYNTYSKTEHKTRSFYVELSQRELSQSYLILDIFDFKDKKYKHWYQYHTDKDFLVQLTFPGSGLYIRQK